MVAPFLRMLADMPVVVRIILNPKIKISDLPLNRFYRTVLPSLQFNADGQVVNDN